jgi:hypothetical protein
MPSEDEIISWILSYKDEARLIGPEWLVERLQETVRGIQKRYQ